MSASAAGALSIYRYTVRRSVGVRASGWARALPAATALIAFVPAVVAVGVPALLERFVATTSSPIALERIRDLARDPSFVPTYPQYLFVISAVILLASAYVAAEAVGGDGELGLRSLYRRSPVSATGYLFAKYLGVATALLVVTAGPLALLVVGGALNGQAIRLADGLRVAGGSVVVIAPYAAFSLLVATVWPRRAVAAGASVLALTAISAVARFVAATSGERAWHLLDLRHAPLELGARVLGAEAAPAAPATPALAAAVASMAVLSLVAIAALQRGGVER